MVDTQQPLNNREEIEELQLQNGKLKKELEREQQLHSLLYKEWKELKEQLTARENEVYESRKKNPFYKYAFYVLLVAAIPALYFLYFRKGSEESLPPELLVSDSIKSNDSASVVPVTKDVIVKSNSIPANTQKEIETSKTQVIVQERTAEPEEKKAVSQESKKPEPVVVRKPPVEVPLTEDIRDSISTEGFNAYFQHRRNPFKKSSERYKIWQEGWNDGKAGAAEVEAKDPSAK